MKQLSKTLALAALLFSARAARATPSTTFWTPATTYTQPYLVPHLTYDTYFGEPGALPIDTGVTLGVLPFEKLQGEVGFDLFYGPGAVKTKAAFLLNGKLTLPEGALGAMAPGISVGVQNVGFEKDVTDLYLVHGTVAKTFPMVGNVGVGAYYGVNKRALVSSDTDKPRAGLMASWTSPDLNVNLPGLTKVVFLADTMTGKNAFGAVGGGIGLYFTPSIDLLAGPVFFLDKDVQPGAASWLWTMQIDVDVDLVKKK